MQFKKNFYLLLLFVISACKNGDIHEQSYASQVNPFIGSQLHGHVFVGANVPFGAVQLGPSQIMRTWDEYGGWDWCSGYNYISEEILGFTHTHLSGTGIGDLNDLLILPMIGQPQLHPMKINEPTSGYGSTFSKQNEKVEPGYYSVFLDKYKVKAELTTTERVGFHKYKFENLEDPKILVDLSFGMGWDSPVETFFKKTDDSTFVGYRYSTGWAKDQRLFFAIRTSTPVNRIEIFNDSLKTDQTELKEKRVKALLYPNNLGKDGEIMLKVGISPVSYENALMNIETEIEGWNFNEIRKNARHEWENALSKIEIEASDSVKTIFYSGLYHAQFAPTLFNDANKDYRGSDKQVYNNVSFNNYTVFSLWDTYRGHHPLMTLINPDRVSDFVETLVKITEQQNALAMWPLHGNETFTMVGNPALIQIADAFRKGLISRELAEEAYKILYKVTHHPTETGLPIGQKWVSDHTWIPADNLVETVAWGMEYAIADDAFSKFAEALNKQEAAKDYTTRAQLYKQYFDGDRGFFIGRMADGSFRKNFDEFDAEHRLNDYIEGNAWQYLFLVPHQVYSLIDMLGGEGPFIKRLDQYFTTELKLDASASNDITGLIGQYAHGNEPSHHVAYLYTYAGKQWKTAELVRRILKSFYTTKPDGLIGNEDAGQMSSWYILSAMGFYPANPNSGQFVFGSPIINKAKIKIDATKSFQITAKNNSDENIYIQRIELNGKPYTKTFVDYQDIMKGGELVFTMGAKPNLSFGKEKSNRPE